jgi:hypothetical protein
MSRDCCSLFKGNHPTSTAPSYVTHLAVALRFFSLRLISLSIRFFPPSLLLLPIFASTSHPFLCCPSLFLPHSLLLLPLFASLSHSSFRCPSLSLGFASQSSLCCPSLSLILLSAQFSLTRLSGLPFALPLDRPTHLLSSPSKLLSSLPSPSKLRPCSAWCALAWLPA